MFALRLMISEMSEDSSRSEESIENHELGDAYCLFRRGTKLFNEILNSKEYGDYDKSRITQIVRGDNGVEFFIEENTKKRQISYFIMSESGKTFEKLR